MNRMIVSTGGGMMVGGGMGGMDTGAGEGAMAGLFSTLPSWISVPLMAALVILGSVILGWIIGQIVGRVMYPDPNKPSVLNKKERTIYIAALAVAMVLVVILVLPKKEKTEDPMMDPAVSANGGAMDFEDPSLMEPESVEETDGTESEEASDSSEEDSSDASSEEDADASQTDSAADGDMSVDSMEESASAAVSVG